MLVLTIPANAHAILVDYLGGVPGFSLCEKVLPALDGKQDPPTVQQQRGGSKADELMGRVTNMETNGKQKGRMKIQRTRLLG